MKIEYLVKSSKDLTKEEIRQFRVLLDKQGQVDSSEGKAERCFKICLVKLDGNAIGIGALKQVYKSPFDYAKVPELKENFNYEIGYLFVDKDKIKENHQGLGVGKYITKILLAEIKNENAFATTEFDTKNPMYHILKSFGFVSMGEIYKGNKTKKDICLMVLTKN
ncbi:MAG TPA: hypothetical protein DEA82_06325 [Flavobacteriaceae bacterium]|jgi:predicted GNAT family N-acyltransferase|nr:hypothetical protein [Flavobacteriaceae bacterium]HBR53804.1 hypothetical protein [Flavobacteriaceae bacterium]|tara:strand:- start:320 stop:814 length:495 start_codon:yes stop_codon:yes gene_type:complete